MIRVWFIILSISSCFAVIYQLNGTEYQRMPPLFFLDDYESCLAEENNTYCLLQLKLYSEQENELMLLIKNYSDLIYKHYDHSIIHRGVCVEKTCQNYIRGTTGDLTHSLEACFSDSLQKKYGLNARFSILYYCDQNEPRIIDQWDWTVLVIILGLVTWNFVGSIYDYVVRKYYNAKSEDGNVFLVSFSLLRNWKRLMIIDMNEDDSDQLKFFNGLRVIINMCVLMSHTQLIFTTGYTVNPEDVEKSYEYPIYQLLFNGLMIVQIFFFMSGFLLIYHLHKAENTQAITAWDIPKILLLKLRRLIPSLAVTLALSTTWVRHMGSGPLWKLLVSGSMVAHCRAYWWRHLFFVNNYLQKQNFCLIPTWHLAADMQVFLVGLTAFILTRGRTRSLLLGVLIVVGACAHALHTVLLDIDTVILSPENYRTWRDPTVWFTHIQGHNHLLGYIIGMVTAARLCDWQKKGSHFVTSKWSSWIQYVSVAVIPLTLYTGHAFFQNEGIAPLVARAAYSVAVRLLLGLACALITTMLFNKTPTYVQTFLEWRYWVVPSRLTYTVFLVHMPIVHIIMGARMQLSLFSFSNIMTTYTCLVVASYLVALPMYLMVEAPFATLFRNLMKTHPKENTESANEVKKRKQL